MNDTHSKAVGYILWIFGFLGAHRFYFGRPVTDFLRCRLIFASQSAVETFFFSRQWQR